MYNDNNSIFIMKDTVDILFEDKICIVREKSFNIGDILEWNNRIDIDNNSITTVIEEICNMRNISQDESKRILETFRDRIVSKILSNVQERM